VADRFDAGWGDHRAADRQLALGHVEAGRRGADEHLSRRRPGHCHAVAAGRAHRHRASGGLQADPADDAVGAVLEASGQRAGHAVPGGDPRDVAVGVVVQRRSLRDPHQRPVGVHLFSRHHRQRLLRALAHLAVRHQDGDDVVRADGDPGVEPARAVGIVGDQAVPAWRDCRPDHPEHQPAAGQRAGADERASCPFAHGGPTRCAPGRGWPGGRGRTYRSGRCW
jgi:hypothetical protein